MTLEYVMVLQSCPIRRATGGFIKTKRTRDRWLIRHGKPSSCGFPKRADTDFRVLGFNESFLDLCWYVQNCSKRVREITLDVSTQHCSCCWVSVSLSCQSFEALFCWSNARSNAVFSFRPSTFTSPESLADCRIPRLKVAGEVSGPWRSNPWRLTPLVFALFSTSSFCCSLCLVLPGSCLMTETLSRSQCWISPQTCATEREKTKQISFMMSNEWQSNNSTMDLKCILESFFTYLKDSTSLLRFVLPDSTDRRETFVLGFFELWGDTTTALKQGHATLPMLWVIQPRQTEECVWHY